MEPNPIADWILARTVGQTGYFLDIGAGVRAGVLHLNNTLRLELERGWTGICVEPQEHRLTEMRAIRKCIFTNAVIAPVHGQLTWCQVAGADYGSGLQDYLKFVTPKRVETRTVGAVTVEWLLKHHGAPVTIDFLSLDTEGSELPILQSFPWQDYHVRFIAVEHNLVFTHDSSAKEGIFHYLTGLGFQREVSGIQDDYYVKS